MPSLLNNETSKKWGNLMDSIIPIQVQNSLDLYISLFNEKIPHTLEGLYIHGSIALNAYIEGISDIDFIAIINRRLTAEEVKIVSTIHRELHKKFTTMGMDGCYLQWEDIGKKQTEAKKCLYVNEGKLSWRNDSVNPITWWILKDKGISVIGPEITSFYFEVDERMLVDYVLPNMNSYWFSRMNSLAKLKRIAFLLPNKLVNAEIEWSITGMLRQYYTLHELDIVSKVDACKYGIRTMPKQWHSIINDALSIRQGVNCHAKSKKQRLDDTIQCMTYILDYCNKRIH